MYVSVFVLDQRCQHKTPAVPLPTLNTTTQRNNNNNTPINNKSLHNLEHVDDPIATVTHYLSLLKPGGGLGVVLPHWRYSWPAQSDDTRWGHRWNAAPEVICELHARHWRHLAGLEALNTYPDWRLSFDFVLRKRGEFAPFGAASAGAPAYRTGAGKFADGSFVGPVEV